MVSGFSATSVTGRGARRIGCCGRTADSRNSPPLPPGSAAAVWSPKPIAAALPSRAKDSERTTLTAEPSGRLALALEFQDLRGGKAGRLERRGIGAESGSPG